MIEVVRKSVGPVAAFKQALIVPKLPKTRSGKVARNTLAAMAAGEPYQVCVWLSFMLLGLLELLLFTCHKVEAMHTLSVS